MQDWQFGKLDTVGGHGVIDDPGVGARGPEVPRHLNLLHTLSRALACGVGGVEAHRLPNVPSPHRCVEVHGGTAQAVLLVVLVPVGIECCLGVGTQHMALDWGGDRSSGGYHDPIAAGVGVPAVVWPGDRANLGLCVGVIGGAPAGVVVVGVHKGHIGPGEEGGGGDCPTEGLALGGAEELVGQAVVQIGAADVCVIAEAVQLGLGEEGEQGCNNQHKSGLHFWNASEWQSVFASDTF